MFFVCPARPGEASPGRRAGGVVSPPGASDLISIFSLTKYPQILLKIFHSYTCKLFVHFRDVFTIIQQDKPEVAKKPHPVDSYNFSTLQKHDNKFGIERI